MNPPTTMAVGFMVDRTNPLPLFGATIIMPCGITMSGPWTLMNMDVRCPCGDPTHWLVRVTPFPHVGKNGSGQITFDAGGGR